MTGLWFAPTIAPKPCWAQSVGARNTFKIGRSTFEKGDYKKALEYFERAVKEEQGYSDAHYMAGLCYLGLKDYEKAKEKLNYTIQIEPKFLPAYQQLGNIFLIQKKYSDAKEHFIKMSRVPGGNASSIYCLGVVAYAQKDLKEAERQFREAVKLDSKMARAENNLGVLQFQQKRNLEAITHFRRAMNLVPDNQSYTANLALVYVEQGDKAQARPLLDKIQRHSGKRLDLASFAQAMEGYLQNRWAECIKDCDLALATNEDLTWAMVLKMRSQKQLKVPDAELKKTVEAIIESDPNVTEAETELTRINAAAATTAPGASSTPAPAASATPTEKAKPAPTKTPTKP
jgi:tetratricopeptide (TPR) repeat protein